MIADSKPVVVVGAGPVGLVSAYSLASRGVPVIVLEANDGLFYGSAGWLFSSAYT